MDLGAGSGILSYFAVKAGASKVYAVEASGMADKIQQLMNHTAFTNTWLKGKLEVIKGNLRANILYVSVGLGLYGREVSLHYSRGTVHFLTLPHLNPKAKLRIFITFQKLIL